MLLVTPVRRWKLFWVSPCYHVGRRIRLSVILLHRVCGTPHCERPRWLWTWVSWWKLIIYILQNRFVFHQIGPGKEQKSPTIFFPKCARILLYFIFISSKPLSFQWAWVPLNFITLWFPEGSFVPKFRTSSILLTPYLSLYNCRLSCLISKVNWFGLVWHLQQIF